MIVLREFAPAKVNLYLHAIGKRADGYHLLDSLAGFADVGDKLEYAPSESLSCAVEGPFATNIPSQDNIVLIAAERLRKQFNVQAGAAMTLHKQLPVGTGLGGGSADAAAALRLLTRAWKIDPGPRELHAIALAVGADVPACLRAQSLYMSGIGEILEPGPPLIGLFIVMVWPGISVLTKNVFTQRRKQYSTAPHHPHMFANFSAGIAFLEKQKNDLQTTAVKLCPEIQSALAALQEQKDCKLARMSGSGSACFGIFATMDAAKGAEAKLAQEHADWWVKAAKLR